LGPEVATAEKLGLKFSSSGNLVYVTKSGAIDGEVVAAIFAVTTVYIACVASNFSDPAQRQDLVISRLALAAVVACAITFTYFVGKLYCSYWARLGGGSKARKLVETLIVPAVPTLLTPGIARAFETRQWSMLLVFAVLFIVLMDLPGAFRRTVAAWFPEPRLGDRFFFLTFPPKRRLDMLPFDITYAAFVGFLFYRYF